MSFRKRSSYEDEVAYFERKEAYEAYRREIREKYMEKVSDPHTPLPMPKKRSPRVIATDGVWTGEYKHISPEPESEPENTAWESKLDDITTAVQNGSNLKAMEEAAKFVLGQIDEAAKHGASSETIRALNKVYDEFWERAYR